MCTCFWPKMPTFNFNLVKCSIVIVILILIHILMCLCFCTEHLKEDQVHRVQQPNVNLANVQLLTGHGGVIDYILRPDNKLVSCGA